MARKTTRAGKESLRHAVEIERKFEIVAGFAIPDLRDLAGVAAVDPPVVQRLDATYLDTADLRLLARGWTLRRRRGGTDAGWHLKRPLPSGERAEATSPLGRGGIRVPPALQREVAIHTRGRALAPIARLATNRTVIGLRDAAGALLAEVMLDQVDAQSLGEAGNVASRRGWYEVEVELGSGDEALLRRVCARLIAAGASPSARPAKLFEALHERLAAQPLPRFGVAARFGPRSAVGVVLAHVDREMGRLHTHDVAVRNDTPEGVHQMRVAARQLRSTLATFRPLFDRQVTDPIRDELAWLGGELGAARDIEVVRGHLVALVAQQPESLCHGPIEERIGTTMAARFREAHRRGVKALDSQRYFDLLEALDRLIADPPLAPGADRKGLRTLRQLTMGTWRIVARRQKALVGAKGADAREACLHEIRKTAKRARYAGEAMAPVVGAAAIRFAKAMSDIQNTLGDHQDSVVARDELVRLAAAAAEAGEPTFTYGRLHALEQCRGLRSEREFTEAWRKLRRKDLTAWLE